MNYTVNDLIGAIEAGHARETEDVFASLVQERQQVALAFKREEIAASMFSSVNEKVELDEENYDWTAHHKKVNKEELDNALGSKHPMYAKLLKKHNDIADKAGYHKLDHKTAEKKFEHNSGKLQQDVEDHFDH